MSRWRTGALIRCTRQWQSSDHYPAKGELALIGAFKSEGSIPSDGNIYDIVTFPGGKTTQWCVENLTRNWEIVEDAADETEPE